MADSKLSDQLYRGLKEDILNLVLEPGQSISIQKISDRYGGSRTPAREAVVRLQQEGLLIVKPQSGTIISPISIERVRQERFVRFALETAVIDDFVQTCNQLTLSTMEQTNLLIERSINREDYVGALQADIRFHRCLFKTSNNLFAFELSMANCSHDMRLRYLSLAVGAQSHNVLEDHALIIEAAQQHKTEQVRTLVGEHLTHWRRVVSELQQACPEHFFSE